EYERVFVSNFVPFSVATNEMRAPHRGPHFVVAPLGGGNASFGVRARPKRARSWLYRVRDAEHGGADRLAAGFGDKHYVTGSRLRACRHDVRTVGAGHGGD